MLKSKRAGDGTDQLARGRHALVTGGGTGIGAAAATQPPCSAGARLSLLGRRLEPLKQVAGIVGGAAVQCDVTEPGAIERAYAEARAANGPIDMLIVNAGIAESAPFDKMTRDSWDRIIAVNLTGAFDCAAGGAARPAGKRERPAGVRRLGREPARRSLRRALCARRSTGCSA